MNRNILDNTKFDNEFYWVSSDDTRVKLTDMDDTYLKNLYILLTTKYGKTKDRVYEDIVYTNYSAIEIIENLSREELFALIETSKFFKGLQKEIVKRFIQY